MDSSSHFNWPLTHWLTNYLIPCIWVFLEKLKFPRLIWEFTAFYGTHWFIAAFTRVNHLLLSLTRSIQSMLPNPTSLSSILILSSHLRVDLSGCLFHSDIPTTTQYEPLLILHTCHVPRGTCHIFSECRWNGLSCCELARHRAIMNVYFSKHTAKQNVRT